MLSIFKKIKNKIGYELYRRRGAYTDFNKGYKVFIETGQTPPSAHKALIHLFCSTNGKFADIEQKKIIAKNPPRSAPWDAGGKIDGVVGNFDAVQFKFINDSLNRDGYINFEKKLPAETIEKLTRFALSNPTKIPPAYDKGIVYDPAKPISEIYRFGMVDLMNNQDIQDLIMDPAIINIARNYLESEPIFDFPAMWWSTAFLKQASVEAAQLYHFDLDRIKWLKIFIYLTDVTPETGPHRYIRGSQISGTKPASLLKRGYARIPDADIKKYYNEKDFTEICAPAGAIFAGDTKCWHKGTPLQKGHRLVLEFQYTSSMFGASHTKLEVTNASSRFKDFCEKEKFYASNIYVKN